MHPVPRREVFDTYWTFAAERQRIYLSRLAGMPAPWSGDPILARFKFCNAYRAADRVSQYLIREVIYDDREVDPEDLLIDDRLDPELDEPPWSREGESLERRSLGKRRLR